MIIVRLFAVTFGHLCYTKCEAVASIIMNININMNMFGQIIKLAAKTGLPQFTKSSFEILMEIVGLSFGLLWDPYYHILIWIIILLYPPKERPHFVRRFIRFGDESIHHRSRHHRSHWQDPDTSSGYPRCSKPFYR